MDLVPLLQYAISGFLGTAKRLSWRYLLISAAVGLVVLHRHRMREGLRDLGGTLRALVPWSIYGHRSSVQDYCWYVLSPLIHVPMLARLSFIVPMTSLWMHDRLVDALGPPRHLAPGVGMQVTAAFVVLLAIDFGNYVAHWLMHHVRFLWEFHKTHHSALVLNPLTADRLHPLERVLIEACVACASGLTLGAFAYWYHPHFTITRILGLNAFAFLTNVISGNLRHSHVWFSYGPVFEYVFSSPAQHHVHHSRAPEHLDKNLATHFALWDWLFGTLYVTRRDPESLVLGLTDDTEPLFRSPWALFMRPFQANWQRLRTWVATRA